MATPDLIHLDYGTRGNNGTPRPLHITKHREESVFATRCGRRMKNSDYFQGNSLPPVADIVLCQRCGTESDFQEVWAAQRAENRARNIETERRREKEERERKEARERRIVSLNALEQKLRPSMVIASEGETILITYADSVFAITPLWRHCFTCTRSREVILRGGKLLCRDCLTETRAK